MQRERPAGVPGASSRVPSRAAVATSEAFQGLPAPRARPAHARGVPGRRPGAGQGARWPRSTRCSILSALGGSSRCSRPRPRGSRGKVVSRRHRVSSPARPLTIRAGVPSSWPRPQSKASRWTWRGRRRSGQVRGRWRAVWSWVFGVRSQRFSAPVTMRGVVGSWGEGALMISGLRALSSHRYKSPNLHGQSGRCRCQGCADAPRG